jgi:hypothetical protein
MQIIIFNKYMDKENKFIEKLDIESTKEFENYKKIFFNNEEDKSLFFNFLFGDLISYEKLDRNTNIETIFKNPEIIIESKINSIVNKIYEKNYNLLEKIKEKFIKTKIDVKSKLDECINHIEILKKSYIDGLIKDFIPVNNEIKLIFTNKKVLVLKNLKKDNYSLAERFIRIIFNSITKDEKKSFIMNNNINLTPNNINNQNISNYNDFYNESNINIYNESENKFMDFYAMNNNFKYWIVLIYLISQLFNTNSNYEILFDEKECKTNIEKLTKFNEEKKKDKKKDKKKKDKKRGGGKEDYDKVKQTNNKKFDKNKNSKIKNLYNDVFEYCYVNSNTNLQKIYINPFDNDIRKYFKSLIKNTPGEILNKSKNNGKNLNKNMNNINENENNSNEYVNNKSGGGSKQLVDPFDKKNIDLKNIIEIKNSENIKNNSKIIDLLSNKKLKYDIYQSLKIYKNEDNLKKLYNFISKIKIKIILLLYSLYKLKKNLYEKFLNKINIIFFNKETISPRKNKKNLNNSRYNGNNENNSNNGNKRQSANNITILNYLNNINIDKRIKNIENEIKLLEAEKGTKNYDEKLLKKDEEIKRLLVQKYKNRFL